MEDDVIEELAKIVDDAISVKADKEASRNYLGASILGEECARKLWYTYHTPRRILDPRVNRIFQLGHILEDYMVKLLRDAGLKVFCEDENGDQFGFTEGKIAGHIDSVLLGVPWNDEPFLAEFKTANSKRFKQFKDKGCEATEIKYFVQCQIYMHKMSLEHCLFMVINKDTQELYYEYIALDQEVAERYLLRGHEIVESQLPPNRKYNKKTFYKCKFCDYSETCWDSLEEE